MNEQQTRTRVIRIATALADAREIDWEAELAREPADPEERELLQSLRELSRIFRAHRDVVEPSSPAADATVQTDDREPPRGRWGPLEIEELLGAGVSAEVYRADHPELGMAVALKLLRPSGATQESLQEGRLLARIRHPNVVRVHGAERHSGRTGVWMELVQGRTLADVVRDSGPMGAREAALVGIDLCRALAALHGAGLVHRDVKAQNVMREKGGRIVLMDLGAGVTRDGEESAGERLGGTPMYMAPEVIDGQRATPASDLYSLGVLLFHLATGSYPFAARSIASLERAREKGQERLLLDARPGLPAKFVTVVERALDPDLERRFRSAGAMERELRAVLGEDIGPPPRPPRWFSRWLRFGALAAGLIVAALAGFLLAPKRSPDPPGAQGNKPSPVHFTQPSPAELDITRIGHSGSAVALSPHGRILTWVGATDEGTQLFVRSLDEDDVDPIAGTEGALTPFFSPDSQWIGFWAGGKLKKVSLLGGAPQTICEVDHPHGASWGDGVIVMGAIGDGTLWRIDPETGRIQRIEITNEPGYKGSYPQLLPGSRHMLVSSEGRYTVDLVSLESGEVTTLVHEGTNGRYLPSGHLVWTLEDDLLAAPFDLSHHAITGEARTLIEGVLTEEHVSHYTVSDEGTLAYLPGTVDVSGLHPVWVALDGSTKPFPLSAEHSYLSPRVSPDGRRLLLSRQEETRSLWLSDPDRRVAHPITSDEGHQFWAIWTPEGASVVFNSQEGTGPANLWMQPVDRSRPPTRLTSAPAHHLPQDITKDARTVLFASAMGPDADFDVHMLHLDAGLTTVPLLASSAAEIHPTLSADGRWLAFASDVTGRFEIHVRPFPQPGGPVRVSPNGGVEPIWSPSGERLFYRSANGRRVFAAKIESTDPLEFGREELLFEGRFGRGPVYGRNWDIHPDGDRFLMLQLESPQPPEGIRVIVDWSEELKSKLQIGG